MNSEKNDRKQHSGVKLIYRFLGGAALGAFLVIIPVSYSSSIDWGLAQIGLASFMVILCGLLSSIWGGKFVDMVARTLNSFGA
jgi:hypothetical protein